MSATIYTEKMYYSIQHLFCIYGHSYQNYQINIYIKKKSLIPKYVIEN